MCKKTITFVLVLLHVVTLGSTAGAPADAQNPPSELRALDTGGDHPITTSYIWQGHGGVLVEPLAFSASSSVSGTFNIHTVPINSSVVHAFFALGEYRYEIGCLSAVFNGVILDTIVATSYDSTDSWDFCYYRWEVTDLVEGNGSYTFSCEEVENCDNACLVLVYENAESPFVRIVVNDGTESLQDATSVTTFSGFDYGNGDIKILTMCGEDGSNNDERIEFNGIMLAGPNSVFVSNIGEYADYFEFDLTNVQWGDSLAITTGGDWIGINLAVLTGEPSIDLELIPFTFPIQIPSGGGYFEFYAGVHNHLAYTQIADIWSKVTMPDGTVLEPLMGPASVSLEPGTTMWYRSQNVPPVAPAGVYSYVGCIGSYPDDIWYWDTLELEKMGESELNGSDSWNNWGESFEVAEVTEAVQPDEFMMLGAFPNPFNPSTTIRFALPEAGQVRLEVYDITGRLTESPLQGWRDAGVHEVTFDGSGLASGIYLYRLEAGEFNASGKMVLLK